MIGAHDLLEYSHLWCIGFSIGVNYSKHELECNYPADNEPRNTGESQLVLLVMHSTFLASKHLVHPKRPEACPIRMPVRRLYH